MHILKEIPLNLIKPIFVPITINHFQHYYFFKPILFINGELETKEDKAFPKNNVHSIKAVLKKYKTGMQTNHYFDVIGVKSHYRAPILIIIKKLHLESHRLIFHVCHKCSPIATTVGV